MAGRPGGPDAGMASQAGRPLRCVYLGNFDERKGVFDFVAVISQAKAAGIAIEAKIMGGATRFVSEGDLQQAIETHGVVDAIELVGFVDEAEKSRILQAADLFIYPTRHDHAPLVLIEAMAHGTVPLTLDAGGIRSMLGSELAHNVFSHRADAEARQTWMVERIQAYATEPAALVRDSDVSRALYERNHTPAAFERDLRAILDRPQVLPRTHPQP
jgi:glycosyltransferase involved in cell wall biosynthesis